MIKNILLLAAGLLILGAILTKCYSPSEKIENAQDNVLKANEELDKANQEYLADIENYKKEVAAKIEANNKSIAEFNARIANEKLTAKEDYQKKIIELDQKNTDMKKRLDEYKADGKDKWTLFKEDFNHELERLTQALKELAQRKVN
jgi:tRNA G10  N-methylase Trm11